MAVTGSDITAAPRRASAWTTSRSLAIPSTAVPSRETTTAPIRCSARTATSCRTLVSGVTVMTWVPLARSTSLIRIGPPRRWYAASCARTDTPGWVLQSAVAAASYPWPARPGWAGHGWRGGPLPGCRAVHDLAGGCGAGRGGWFSSGFDGQAREDAVQPAGQPPVGAAGQVHEGGDEDGAQEEGVEQHGSGQADADLADDLLAGQDERAEHQDHDGGGGDDDPAGGGLAGADRLVVVAGGDPFLADPGDQEDLVIHGQAEQDRDHQHGQERFDRPGLAEVKQPQAPAVLEDGDHHA